MCWLKILCAVTSLVSPAGSTGSGEISGLATVQDGDTIYVNHQAVRLWGVDAEELSEPHGDAAKFALRALIGGASVTCIPQGTRSYARTVARCYIGDAELNRSIVASGRALDCQHYSAGEYRADEPPGARARLKQKGYC